MIGYSFAPVAWMVARGEWGSWWVVPVVACAWAGAVGSFPLLVHVSNLFRRLGARKTAVESAVLSVVGGVGVAWLIFECGLEWSESSVDLMSRLPLIPFGNAELIRAAVRERASSVPLVEWEVWGYVVLTGWVGAVYIRLRVAALRAWRRAATAGSSSASSRP